MPSMSRPCYSVFHNVLFYVLMIAGNPATTRFTFFYGVALQDDHMTGMFTASVILTSIVLGFRLLTLTTVQIL